MERAKAGALIALLMTTACTGAVRLDLGSNDAGASPPPVQSSAPSIAGTWSGYAALTTFADGSDVMTLVIAQASDGSYSGTLSFGASPPPPPPTDQNAGYPPHPPGTYPQKLADVVGLTGFAYTLESITFDGVRVQFALELFDLWKAWCGIEQPYYWQQPNPGPGPQRDGYYCAPFDPGVFPAGPAQSKTITLPDGGEITPDPLVYELCGWPGLGDLGVIGVACVCDANACALSASEDPMHFDLRLAGDALDGVGNDAVVGILRNGGNVHFTRR